MRYRSLRLFSVIFAFMILQLQLAACGGGGGGGGSDPQAPVAWPIANQVYTTAQQQIMPVAVPPNTPQINPGQVSLYAQYGYSAWQAGPGLDYVKRTDLAPGYDKNASNAARLLSFFSMSDIHIADKESPAQPIYIALKAGFGSNLSSAYSPIILSTPQVLDAAVQTINVLHSQSSFDFGISLGDDANNTQYNELRWFIDVMDGKVITPSSGANLGADTIDYQMPFQAAGLNSGIPWYAVIGNHDQFWMGSSYEDTKTLNAHVSNTIINMAYSLNPAADSVDGTGYYMGVVLGWTPYGDIFGAGPAASYPTPPTVVADANRHSLSTSTSTSQNWMREFFTTTSNPAGHGFTQTNLDNDFACYSFVPKATVPIKVIVLDDTCKGPGQENYATGCLDTPRLTWLESELQAGQDNNQLMIIAAHVPVNPQADPNNKVYYGPFFTTHGTVVTDAQLLAILHTYPNLIMWIAGHRHVNVITPQPSPDPVNHPEQAFWQVETASLRDFPQEFRTFDIRRNTDKTISIVTTDVDPAVSPGSPAAKSRGYAIGAARVFGNIPFSDTASHAYNAELVKQLSSKMQGIIANCGTPLQ
ncbi:MAG: TIGR03768 family metallophosphoesterase [Syntrophorhabdales bacterium]|jgi:metallophosphoesterase (TIGR03768 family)